MPPTGTTPSTGSAPSVPRPGPDYAARLGGDAVLMISGELDLVTRLRLRWSIREVLRLAPDRLVVDLAGVTFIDASALGELVAARAASRSAGGDLAIRSPSAPVRRVLDIVELADLVDHPVADGEAAGPVTAEASGPSHLGAAWEAACLTPEYGSSPLVFDLSLMMPIIASLFDDQGLVEADGCAEVPGVGAMRPGTSAVVAVMQLWALNDVMHSWVDANPGQLGPEQSNHRRRCIEAALAGVVASVLTELERSSLIDPLTGLLNRRALDRDLREALAVTRRHEGQLTVVMVDVEGLKTTNDRFGHAAGDVVLRGVASCLAAAVRTGDNVYRIGGDEFVLILPDLSADDVEAVMHRTTVGAPSPFSWGCASVADLDGGDDGAHATHLLDLADQRMLENRARARLDRRVRAAAAPTPVAPTMRQPDEEGVATDALAESYRARVVVDWAKGVIAEGFEVSIDDASSILQRVASARESTVLAVSQRLMGRTIDGSPLPPHPAGRPAVDLTDPVLAVDGLTTSVER